MKTTYYIEILKAKVEQEFAPEILSFANCNSLSDNIFEKTNSIISVTTLQRAFGLIDTKSKLSTKTLDILSHYVGFDNWRKFQHQQETPSNKIEDKYIPDEMAIILLGICLKNHDFKTALEYLDVVSQYDEGKYSNMIGPVFKSALRTNKKARKILIPELTKTRSRRSLTVERSVDIESLDIYYHNVIIESKKNIDYDDKELYNSDLAFYNSVLFLHSINHNSKKSSIKYAYELISKIRPEEANEDNIKYAFPIIRYHATYLMYLHLTKQLNDKQLNFVIEQIEAIILNNDSNNNLESFAISEMFKALVFCKRYNDIIFLYNKYKKLSLAFDSDDEYYQITMSMVERSYLEVAGCSPTQLTK